MKGRDKMKKKEQMDIVFILDKSGSMGGTESDTIGGYNSYIDSFKDKDIKVTTVLFNDHHEMITNRTPIKDIKELTRNEYRVGGCTALLDALGNTINYMDNEKSKKAMFIITTDGLENASREYTKEKIKSMIEKHTNWEFIYIGANIDSYNEGSQIGIKRSNISNYDTSSKGICKMYKAASMASEEYLRSDSIGTAWKEELEDYISNNEKK